MLTLEKLCELINANFGYPFLPKDTVSAEVLVDEEGQKTLTLQIGRRDIEFDENGEFIGGGTMLG